MLIQKVICNKCEKEIIGEKEISDSWISNRNRTQDNLCETCRREYEFELGLLHLKIKELNEKYLVYKKEE
jgi:hypothetical protein